MALRFQVGVSLVIVNGVSVLLLPVGGPLNRGVGIDVRCLGRVLRCV